MDEEKKLGVVQPAVGEVLPSVEAGRLVRRLREQVGLTQAELAVRLGERQSIVSAIENCDGTEGPSYALVKRIAAACGADWPALAAAVPSDTVRVILVMDGDAVEADIASAQGRTVTRHAFDYDPERGAMVAKVVIGTR